MDDLLRKPDNNPFLLENTPVELQTREDEQGRLMRMYTELSDHPSGGDPFIGLASQAIVEMSRRDPSFLDLIIDLREVRHKLGRPLTLAHAALLAAVHAVNNIMIFKEGMNDFPFRPEFKLETVEGWIELYMGVLDQHRDLLTGILSNRDIQTTDVHRGIALPLIVQRLFGEEEILAADLGCSDNRVWTHLAMRGRFGDVDDTTNFRRQKKLFQSHARHPINIKEVIGIDRTNPLATTEDIDWLLSCRHFREVSPEAISATFEDLHIYDEFRKRHEDRVRFQKGNIINPPLVGENLHLVTMLTVLYQLPENLRQATIQNALALLDPARGVLVIQDYCHVNDQGELEFRYSGEKNSYRTIIIGPATDGKFMEIACYPDTRCRKITAGRDLKAFFRKTQLKLP